MPSRTRRAARLASWCAVVLATLPAPARAGTVAHLVSRLNAERARVGQGPLRADPELSSSAARQSRRQLRAGRMQHSRRLGIVGFRRMAELIAFQPGRRLRTGSVARGWRRSPVHSALVESPSFRLVGVGWARGRLGGRAVTFWTVQLGTR